MTGLDKILSEIENESREAALDIIAKANAEAERIFEEKRKESEKEIKAIKESTAKKEEDIMRRAKSTAEREARNGLLKKKQELIQEVIDEAKTRLLALPDEKYFEILEKLLDKFAHNTPGEILMSERDLARQSAAFSAAVKERGLVFSSEKLPHTGGFVLRYGEIEERCTFDAIIEAERDRLCDEAAKILFG